MIRLSADGAFGGLDDFLDLAQAKLRELIIDNSSYDRKPMLIRNPNQSSSGACSVSVTFGCSPETTPDPCDVAPYVHAVEACASPEKLVAVKVQWATVFRSLFAQPALRASLQPPLRAVPVSLAVVSPDFSYIAVLISVNTAWQVVMHTAPGFKDDAAQVCGLLTVCACTTWVCVS